MWNPIKSNLALLQTDNTFYAEHKNSALTFARHNALRRIVRCLFAERIIDKNLLMFAPRSSSAWLPLWDKHAILFFEDLWAAPADTFINRGSITLLASDGAKTLIDMPHQLIDLLLDQFDFFPEQRRDRGP